jgi:hypothetical protein
MRRFAFALAATGLLLVFAPAGALAHHHRHGHKVGARHTRIRKFGDLSGRSTTTTSPSSTIGTVQSFTGGVLTILLNDNSTVSGTVTNDTAIECSASGESQGSGEDQGEQNSSSSEDQGDQTSGTDEQGEQGEQGTQGEQSGSGDDDQSEGQSQSSSTCTPSNGTPVRAAELKISSAGKTWEKVELGP